MGFTGFHLAWRNLAENRASSLFLVGAVAAGVGFQIPNTANLDGYRAELVEQGVRSGFGDVRVRPAGLGRMERGVELAERLRREPGVRDALAVVDLPGAIGSGSEFRGAVLVGVDMTRPAAPFRLADGRRLDAGDDAGVVLGQTLAERLEVRVGDTVQVRAILSSGADALGLGLEGADEGLGRYTMTVRGLASGSFGASNAVFVDYQFLARELGTPGAASHVYVYLHDHDRARALAAAIQAGTPQVEATAWMDDDAFIPSAIESSRVMATVSETMVVFAVAIPVLALLYIHVLRRRRDIGLLAAIGFSPFEIFTVFLVQAALVGALGIALGCGLGYGLVAYFQEHVIFQWEGFVIRPLVSVRAFVRPALVVFLVTLVAGVFPAWRAARVHPAGVLRGVE